MKTNSFKRILSFGMAAIMFLAVTACGRIQALPIWSQVTVILQAWKNKNGQMRFHSILEKTVKSILQS